MTGNRTLLIVYHSQSGNTERLAFAAAAGAREVPDIDVRLAKAASVNAGDLKDCRVLIVCSPEYFGYMAGAIKDLFDRTYEELQREMTGKPHAVLISAGNDGTGALTSIERIITGYRLKRVQEPIISRGPISADDLEACRALGKTLAAGIDFGIY